MNYEQKYNTSLEQAKKELKTCGTLDCDAARLIFRLFPQLRESESEDDRIRKELLAVINDLVLPDEQRARFNAYLEKQKEQLSLMDGNTDLYFDEWNQQQTKSPTKRQCFEEGMRYSQRLQKDQKPAEWSEEDEERIQRIHDFMWKNRKGDTDTIYQIEKDADWLKSLRPDSYKNCNSRWKPSEAQMKALQSAIVFKEIRKASDDDITPLKSLYEQLKAL